MYADCTVFHSMRFALVGRCWRDEWVADFGSCCREREILKGGFTSTHECVVCEVCFVG